MTPEEEGIEAAKQLIPFAACPYTYQNSGAKSMDEYAAMGAGPKRNAWFDAWQAQLRLMNLRPHNFQKMKDKP